MRNGSALILLGVDTQTQTAKVLDPLVTPHVAQSQPFASISTGYTGYAFLVRAAAENDARVVAAGGVLRNHWFWSVVKVHLPSYGHIAIAAFLINTLALATPLFTMAASICSPRPMLTAGCLRERSKPLRRRQELMRKPVGQALRTSLV